MSERRVIVEFNSPQFTFPLDEIGMEFGDKSDEHLTAKDVADLISEQYDSFAEFIGDFMLDSAQVFIQLEGFNGGHYTQAEVEL